MKIYVTDIRDDSVGIQELTVATLDIHESMVEILEDENQELLTRAYNCLNTNEGFRKALAATKGCTLTHSMGKNKITETVLTEREFIKQLNRLRSSL